MLSNQGRLPAHHGLLSSLNADAHLPRGVRGRGDARSPRQPVRDGGVGVVEVEVVLGARQTSGEVNGSVLDILWSEGGIGSG